MAEGDTIHRSARRLNEALASRKITSASAPNRRSPLHPHRSALADLVGREVNGATAHGKHLFVRFEGNFVLHSHLGMSGSWDVHLHGASCRRNPVTAWVILENAESEALLFGAPHVVALRTESQLRNDPRLRSLGPDILRPDFAPATGRAALRDRAHRDRGLGDALLDQSVIAGIGNIFKSEGCFAAQVSPWLRLRDLDDETLERVVGATAELMREALESGRHSHQIYARTGAPCPRCGTPIRSRGQGDANRTTYWCPVCQPAPD